MAISLTAKPTGKPADIIAKIAAAGGQRMDEVGRLVATLYNLGPQAGINPDAAISQISEETDKFRSSIWQTRLNPSGIGVTGPLGGGGTDYGYSFRTGTEAAEVHLVHLAAYIFGACPAALKPFQPLDPRWQAVFDAGYAGKAKTVADLSNTWAADPAYGTKIAAHYAWLIGDAVMATLTFGKVPFPGYVDRQAQTAHKPEGVGWDNLGKRTPMFIVLHRMEGTLTGTDEYFPTADALTDYGIGTANVDGAALDGYIYQWNDPYGYRAGWASGPVSAPYGDGLKWLNWSGNKWGYSICNVCGVSIENSGNYTDPMTDFAFGELAKFVAYWFDQWRIPYDKAPIRPDTGISAITWHQEWTIGTGKICPGPWLMDRTQALIDAAAAIMKPYQIGATEATTPTQEPPKPSPKPAPKPKYAKPILIPELALLSKEDNDKARAVVTGDGAKFVYVGDRVKAIRDTPRLQKAAKGAAKTGPTITRGTEFDVMWRFTAKDGNDYFYTPFGTRILAADCERVSDTPDYAK